MTVRRCYQAQGDLAYLRVPAETETYSTYECALACTIWPYDHVQAGPGMKFDSGIRDKVRKSDSNDGTGLVRLLGVLIIAVSVISPLGPVPKTIYLRGTVRLPGLAVV